MVVGIRGVEGTDLFVGEDNRVLQMVRVVLDGPPGEYAEVTATGEGGEEASPVRTVLGPGVRTLVPVELSAPCGMREEVSVVVQSGEERVVERWGVVAAEPGWTVHMVCHFHFDPVWWNSQANVTDEWPQRVKEEHPYFDFQGAAFEVVDAHLDLAEREAEYRFVLAELDYLKPYWDSYPERRPVIRRLLAEGRLELVGGTYNEPNTNLSSPEATLRNAVYGMAFQRSVLGGSPETTWQLDVFGHDPSYPSLMSAAGLHNTSWARGPFHQNGPTYDYGESYAPFFSRQGPFRDPKQLADACRMQFPSEFEWVSPDGVGLPTAYMAGHYMAGWRIDSAVDLETAEWAAFALFELLKPVSATRQVLLPVGTDFARPNRWVTQLAEDWNKRYLSPHFIASTPRQFFAALQEELRAEGRSLLPQTRDMNPVWTGKDVSLIDTKRAQRLTESRLGVAEMLATVASSLGSPYPLDALDVTWRQVLFGAHHDAVTGTCSDQVFIDLLGSWRHAERVIDGVLDEAIAYVAEAIDTSRLACPIVVFNPEPWSRTEVVSLGLQLSPGNQWSVLDAKGQAVPAVFEGRQGGHGGALRFLGELPPGGVATFDLSVAPRADGHETPGSGSTWESVAGAEIKNEWFAIRSDPAAGGGLASIVHLPTGRELVRADEFANELVVYGEYPDHPVLHEGPWHLSPDGRAERAKDTLAEVAAQRSATGQRLVIKGHVGPLRYEQEVTLWSALDRIDVTTAIEDFQGVDQLVRVVFPLAAPGGLPFAEAGQSVVGRSFGFPAIDTATGSWTLDTPAFRFAGVGTTASVRLYRGLQVDGEHSLGVGELIIPGVADGPAARAVVVALARVGVTTTTSIAGGARYGALEVDSNLPDFRIALGGPEDNSFVAHLVEGLDGDAAAELIELLAPGTRPVWVPAARDPRAATGPGADLRGSRDLPVLVVPFRGDVQGTCDRLVEDLGDAVMEASRMGTVADPGPEVDHFTVAVINRGTPGFVVDPEGRFYLSLLRSCTGWPSGVWVDEPARPSPDGSGYHLSHWSHTFSYSIVAGPGDWRALQLPARSSAFNRPPPAKMVAPGPGRLGTEHSFYALEPSKEVILSALKITGNPHAEGRDCATITDPALTFRLYAVGRDVRASVKDDMGLGPLFHMDALEHERGAEVVAGEVDLGAWEPVTFTAPLPTAQMAVAENREPSPVYARYWLHNTGAAPAGFVPVSLSLAPRRLVIGPEPATVRLMISSDRTDASVRRSVEVGLPKGWAPGRKPFEVELAPGETQTYEFEVVAPPNVNPGIYYAKVVVKDDIGQILQDTVRLQAGGATSPPGDDLVVEVAEDAVQIGPRGQKLVHVEVTNRTLSAIDCQLDAVAPLDAWALLPTPTVALEVPAMATAGVDIPVVAGPTVRPGKWWLLIKATWYGQRSYSRTLPLEVTPP